MSDDVNAGPGIHPTLRRLSKLMRAAKGKWHIWIILFATPILIIALYSWPRQQSYVVEAHTLGLEVTILGPDTLWKLPASQFCKKLQERDLRRAAGYSGDSCNPGLFENVPLTGSELRIPAGVRILMRSSPDGHVLFRRLDDSPGASTPVIRLSETHDWDVGSVMIFAPENWKKVSLLEFAGDIAIGQEAGTGADSYLIEGRYEVRERFWWYPLRPNRRHTAEPTAIVSGALFRGDYVSFRYTPDLDTGPLPPVLLNGFVTPVPHAGTLGLSVVVSNGLDPSNALLAVKRFGAREIRVSPSWIDRARRDPLLLALTAILGFAVTSLTFSLEIRRLAAKKEK